MSRARDLAYEALSGEGKSKLQALAMSYQEKQEEEQRNADSVLRDSAWRKAQKKARQSERRKVKKVFREDGL